MQAFAQPTPSPRAVATPLRSLTAKATHTPWARIEASFTYTWLVLWTTLLAGLAIGGRGFAYIGLPPLFISEIVVVTGVVVLMLQQRWRELFKQPTVIAILVMGLWGVYNTLPYLGQYGMDALRDAVTWGYAIVGMTIAVVLMSRPWLLPWVLGRYQKFALFFLALMPGLWLVVTLIGDSMPGWPWASHVNIISLKPGDIPVHVGGVCALAILGFFGGRSRWWPVSACILIVITGSVSRGGLIACMLAFSIAAFNRPKGLWSRRFVTILLIGMVFALLVDVSVKMPGRGREFSPQQLIVNVLSVASDEDKGDLDDTKEWRLNWWHEIMDYTFNGPYFLRGKGYGINLATDDGFQVGSGNDVLRSPHNIHMTFLGRSGVPGFATWIGFQLVWLYSMLNGYITARRQHEDRWAMLFVFYIAFWSAFNFNASFDVYFEGPMGGIWFWSLTGVGIGSAWIFKHHPEVLRELPVGGRKAVE